MPRWGSPLCMWPGGLPSEALLAYILVKKYADYFPLYRQTQMIARTDLAHCLCALLEPRFAIAA